MPTGYTADLVEGKDVTFEDFATKCMRAFGATIHMRDDPLDKNYQPREPSDYHKERVKDKLAELKEIENTSEKELKKKEVKRLEDNIRDERERIKEREALSIRLNNMLTEVKLWEPPTEDHEKFKEFMIDQLEKTIEWDTDVEWNEKSIKEYQDRINNIDSIDLKENKIKDIKDSIDYHKKEYQKEVERCNESNEWVDVLLESI